MQKQQERLRNIQPYYDVDEWVSLFILTFSVVTRKGTPFVAIYFVTVTLSREGY